MIKIQKGAKHLSVEEDRVKSYLLTGWHKLDKDGKQILSAKEKGSKAVIAENKKLKAELAELAKGDKEAELKVATEKVAELTAELEGIFALLNAKDSKEFKANLTKLVETVKGEDK